MTTPTVTGRTSPVCAAEGCARLLPRDAHPNRKYHNDKCQQRQSSLNYRRRKKVAAQEVRQAKEDHHVTLFSDVGSYHDFIDLGYPEVIEAGGIKQQVVARLMDVDTSAVSRWMKRWRAEEHIKENPEEHWDTEPDAYSDDPVEDFVEFRSKNFLTPKGEPYYTPPHQRRWAASTLQAWQDGKCLIILSPPRHGKTELMIHFCVWLIVRFPNIRILFVGGSADIAEESVGSVKDHLERNENLKRYLSPGETYKPRTKSGRSWTNGKFTVAHRTIAGIKGSTMRAIGRGGRIRSLDADLIVVDDPEDHDSTVHPGAREETRGWWAKEVMSRKEEHTGVMVITSRVHPDDLAGHLAGSDRFEAIIEQAHDENCGNDPEDVDAHIECVLWPEMRSYEFLYEKMNDPIEGEVFGMVWQNKAIDAGMATFKPDDIAACMDEDRAIGHIPDGTFLIAGLDPSVSGFQAAFLWAVDPNNGRRYLVDIDNRSGGGIDPAFELMKRWYDQYQLRHWVIEDNLYHGAIREEKGIIRWARMNYITLEGHETWGTNKWDRHFGVTSMAQWFRGEVVDDRGCEVCKMNGECYKDHPIVRMISLPAADSASREVSNEYKKQLINFNRDVVAMRSSSGRAKKRQTGDIVMAAWFPERIIRRMLMSQSVEVEYDYSPTEYPFARMDMMASVWG